MKHTIFRGLVSRLLVAAGREGLSAAGCERRSGACECPPHELAGTFVGYSPRNHQRITKESLKNHLRLTAAWRYAASLLLAVFVSIGNMWGAGTTLIDYTLPDLTSSTSIDASATGYSIKGDKIGGANSSGKTDKYATKNDVNFYKFSSNYAVKKGTASGSWILFTLTSGAFQTGDTVHYTIYSGSAKTDGLKTSAGTGSDGCSTSATEVTIGKFTLAEDDNGKDTLRLVRINSSCYINRIWITRASGPKDPTITFNNGEYTIGGSALDLSTLFTSNSSGEVTYSVTNANGTGAEVTGTSFTATTAGTATVQASQAAETGKYNAKSETATITVNAAATPVCPDGISISGTTAYTEGETIELTAALEEGNGEITYTWYKGSIAEGNEVGTGASFSKASCATSDAGNYFCVATKDACSDEESSAYAVTVEESTCPTSGVVYSAVTTATSNVSIATTDGLELNTATHKTEVSGGKMYVISKQSSSKNLITNGAFCLTNNDTYFKVELDCALAAGDVISINVGKDGSNDRGVWVSTATSRPSSAPACALTAKNASLTPKTYEVTSTDEYVGQTILYIYRATANSTYFNNVVITRPYDISFASAKGAAPSATKGFEVELEQITEVEGWVHTGWTADKAVKVGETDKEAGATLAVDAVVTVSSDVTFTAVWEEEIAAVDPEQTFVNGTYTIGGAVLDLSTLFTSNNTVGEVTYSVKTAGETGATIDGVNFTATAAGEAVVTASQAASNGFNAKSIDATITVSAPVEVDGIKMVEEGALTGNFRTSQSLTPLSGDSKYTITGLDYTKYIKFGSSVSSWSAVAGPSNKYLAFTPTKEKTNFYFYVHNNANSASYINLYLVEEGNTTPSKVQVAVAANENALKEYELNITKNTEVYITAESNNVYFCQVVAVESGNALKQAPEVGYVMNLNKGRLSTASGVATTLEGLTFYLGSGYSIASGSNISIGTKGTHYVSFTIPAGQTRQLQLTTNNTAKYTVSKTLGDDENQITPVSGTAKNFNLTAGTWYINPQGSNVNITNIAFAATPTPLTVTFKDGEDILDEQALFSGDKATALDPAPTKDGYRFVEWRLNGSAYDFDTEVTADIILDAAWQEVVTVTFVPANGEDNFTKQADKGAVLAEGDRPADPVRAGYVFKGWTGNTSAEPVVYVNLATETFSEDATLTAVWEVAQTDATISALSYNENAIDVESAENVAGVATYTVHLQWGSTINASLISVTKTASTAAVGTITYDSDAKKATFTVTAGDGITTADYAIQFVIDAKRGTSLIKATTNNVVTGLIGGTIDQSYSGNANTRKLNANNYFGVTLANDETFKEGDVFIVNITTAADLGKFMVFADKDRTELIADQGIVYTKPDVASPVVCPTGEMMLVLPAAAEGKKSLYLSRENVDNSEQWNVTFSYIEVTREMAPAIKSFKFGDDAATINESAKTISIDVPYATDVTALTPTVEAYGNNGATYTPDGATDFTTSVNYVVTDAYGELSTTYAVTVNVAAPSENAYLASLSVAGYALDFNKETTTYNIVLDYGTTVLPEITYEVEEVGLATAVKAENGVNGATTITVTPQAGAGHEKVYTINFSVSTTPKFVIYDGSTMTVIGTSGSDVSTGFAWEMIGGKTDGGKDINITLNGKTYTKAQNVFGSSTNSTTRYIEITIPEGYVAKFYLAGATNRSESLRSSYISKDKTGTLDESIAYASTDQYAGAAMRSDYQLPGTYYYCADASIRLYELSVTLYPAYMRDVTVGTMGTVCIPQNVEAGGIIGAEVYELLYWKYGTSYADCQMVDFGEVTSMQAGHAYLFIPTGDKLALVLGDEVAGAPVAVRGFTGTFDAIPAAYDNVLTNKYAVLADHIQKMGHNCSSPANRAYIDLSATPDKEGYEASFSGNAPAVRRISLGNGSARPVTTDLDNLNGSGDKAEKHLINGHLYIIRGGRAYDAEGRLVK